MKIIRVLFVCLGNICRSPMAEFILKDMVDREFGEDSEFRFQISSAATSTYEIGNDIYPPAKEKLREKGIDFDRRSARRVIPEDYVIFDYLIGMEDSNIEGMKLICGDDTDNKMFKILDFAGIDKNVADPWYTGDFESTYNDLVTGCEAFIKMLKEKE